MLHLFRLGRWSPLLAVAALMLTACPNNLVDPPGEGEGEGEGGEGEGEGEPPLPKPTATLSVSPRFGVPADGLSALSVSVQLAGEFIDARSVTLSTTTAGPEALDPVVSGVDGAVDFALVSTIPGTFTLELEVDGELIDVGVQTVEFTTCRSLEEAFLVDAWPVALSRCIGCHNEFGFSPSLGARFILPFPGDEDFAVRGVAAVRNILELTAADGLDLDTSVLTPEQRTALRLEDDEASLPLILANPILADITGHTGGVVMTPSEVTEIGRFRSFIARVQAGADTCAPTSANGVAEENLLAGLTLLDASETLKKATLTLTGASADAADVAAVDDAGLPAALQAVLEDPRTEVRMGEIFNDWIFTDAALGTNPVYLNASFPDRFFFERLRSEGAINNNSCDDAVAGNCCRIPEDPLNLDADDANDVPLKPENVLCEAKRLEIRRSAAREPVELLQRIWRDELPASEIVQANFTVVDPALARAYGLLQADGRTFKDGVTTAFNANPADDVTERRSVRIIETNENLITDRNASLSAWPHQGLLSSPSLLRRHPTTTSNRERTRARFVYDKLLGIDVMKLAAFATPEIPAGQSLENLTWDTQPCIVCHTLLDPVAGAFNHFVGNGGALTARRPCRNEGMRHPGFGYIALPGSGDADEGLPRPTFDDADDCPVPFDGAGNGANDTKGPARLAWLADRVVEHPRFAYAVVVPLYEGLVGVKLLSAPDSLIDPDFEAKSRAFVTQQKELQALTAVFRQTGGQLKPIVRAILLSRSFRAASSVVDVDVQTARALELMAVGAGGLLLTPEVLDRKITSLVGIPWTHLRSTTADNGLVSEVFYSIFAGGIDSEFVTLRSRDPVAVRAAVARRLGNELSCIAVPQEFSIVDPSERKLFTLIEPGEVPLDVDGNIVPAVETRVKAQIRQLHTVLWNEATLDEEEVEASYELFLGAIEAMRAPSAGTTAAGIGGTCQAVALFTKLKAGETRPPYPATGTVVINGIEHKRVTQDPDFTVRAWMAVLSALLSDGRFLFE
ncbi:MAG: DUF1588 domain-containing protein [Deltaproteobacteria bacterium]|nr:DUF1588 domain-containing protein [Deltaproteobacteria bacterium]